MKRRQRHFAFNEEWLAKLGRRGSTLGRRLEQGVCEVETIALHRVGANLRERDVIEALHVA